MLETQEQIDFVLATAGEDLKFSFGTIKGIPGQLYYNIQSFNSPYDIEKQDFTFRISYKDFFENVIVEKDNFEYINFSVRYLFEVTSYNPDLLGWAELKVNLLGIESV